MGIVTSICCAEYTCNVMDPSYVLSTIWCQFIAGNNANLSSIKLSQTQTSAKFEHMYQIFL